MANATSTGLNPLDLVVPGYQVEQLALDRQRALAAALQQDSMSMPQGTVVNGLYLAPNPMQYVAKLGEGAIAKNWNGDLDRQAVQHNQMAMQQMAAMLSGNQPAAAPSVPDMPLGSGMDGIGAAGASPATAQGAGGGNPFSLDNIMRGRVAQALGGDAAAGAYWKQFEPTDLTKTMAAAGIDPNSTLGRQILQQNIAKSNYIAPESHRAGSFSVDPVTRKTTFFPTIPEGGTALYDANGNPAGVAPLPGAADVIGQVAGKKEKAKADMKPIKVWNPQTGQYEYSSEGAVTQPANFPTIDTSKNEALFAQTANAALADPKASPQDKADAQQWLSQHPQYKQGGAAAEAPPGTATGAESAQKELSKKWTDLSSQNQQAQTTNSYLQSIKSLAVKAKSGPMSDRVAYTNAILSYAGLSDKATDELTAKNLLDKYSNQITARLGQGGLATDQARAILQSAYPNSKMTPDAVSEAVDNLVAANKMVQAKTSLLAPHANARDPQAYSQKEVTFDQNADPRIWQFATMSPQQKAVFKAKLAQSGEAGDFATRIRNLESIGVKFK